MAKEKIEINDGPFWAVVHKWQNAESYHVWEKTIKNRACESRSAFLEMAIRHKGDWKRAYRDGYRCIRVDVVPGG